MGKRTIAVLAVLAWIVALLQKTPVAFLTKDVADFFWGLAGGLGAGAVFVWHIESDDDEDDDIAPLTDNAQA